jgi:DNA helicase-2/ATP-dependent DNA helicase PcrA
MPYDDGVIDADLKKELLLGLDPAQQSAITSTAPLLAVIAGAGSGKTGVLTRRVAYRCFTESADAAHVAVLTFTRQAASELRRRLRALGLRDTVIAGTFHSVALALLRQRWDEQGKSHPVVVADRRRLIGEVIGPKRTANINDLSSDIDWARSRNITADRYASTIQSSGRRSSAPVADVVKVMSDVQMLKRKRGVIDLDDLLSLTIDAMRDDSNFANIVHWKIRHLFVDEAQDLNPLQLAVLDQWRIGRDDLTLVGDPSQSIYGFNGADPTVLTALEQRFPGIEVIRLSANYRCTPQVVQAGLRALSHLPTEPPQLFSTRPDGASVQIFGFDDEKTEAIGIAQIIESWRTPTSRWRDFAVLARTNAQLAPLRDALTVHNIPTRIIGSVAADPVQRATREVGDLPSSVRIATWSRDARAPLAEDSTETEEDLVARRRVADAVDEFLAEGGGDGRTFLAWVRTNRPFEDERYQDSVELLTFHGAKGREWDNVVLAGCEQGLIPHSSAKTPAETAEEIRLAYVAMTRAADRLALTHAHSRRGRSRTRSPFIEGVDMVVDVAPPSADYVRDQTLRRQDLEPHDHVYDELLMWRTNAGRVANLDPTIFCSDEVLRRIAQARPTSVEELSAIDGFGQSMALRVGQRVLAAVQRGIEQTQN